MFLLMFLIMFLVVVVVVGSQAVTRRVSEIRSHLAQGGAPPGPAGRRALIKDFPLRIRDLLPLRIRGFLLDKRGFPFNIRAPSRPPGPFCGESSRPPRRARDEGTQGRGAEMIMLLLLLLIIIIIIIMILLIIMMITNDNDNSTCYWYLCMVVISFVIINYISYQHYD